MVSIILILDFIILGNKCLLSPLDSCKSMIAILAMQIEGYRVANGKETLWSVHPKLMQKANIHYATEYHPK